MKTQDTTDIKNYIKDFLEIYDSRPIKENSGGTLSVNLFHLYYILKKYKPATVIESGVFKGQTTWLINQLLPETKIVAIEPFLQQVVYKGENTKYITTDFLNLTNEFISKDKAKETLVIFDDHQDAYKRIMHAEQLGFKNFYFDDNYPEFCGKRHLSLAAVLNDKYDPGFEIPYGAKENLENIIETYNILPPVLPYSEYVTMENSYIEEKPIFEVRDDSLQVFDNDMHNYRWHTYVTLKDG
jgi:hypothetical protein|tara:strand:+ start:6212 stop:6934 length:723 start_codon:yes stop_codon:yes gene_type:complete